ncbi:MAG: homoserine kinase [Solirubrobacterales bacterium]
MIKVRIPATTANMGPGFDAMGMALNLYNDIEFEEKKGETLIYNNGVLNSDDYRKNMIYTSLIKALDKCNYKYEGFKINVSNCDIPMCRGLGSSSSCIVGGIFAANAIMGNIMSLDDIIDLATEIEGHPDNVVPAITGGMVTSLVEEGRVYYSKIKVPSNLRFITMIPSIQVSTEKARGVMPGSYSRPDCIYSLSRAAMLISALNNGELDKLRVCFGDKIHQPYRKTLIQNADEIFSKSKELGALGEFISGSGSTLMAVVREEVSEKFKADMEKYLCQLEGNWRATVLEPDLEGVRLV